LCSLNSRKLSVGDSAYAAEEITAQMCWAFYVLESTTGTCMEVRPISTIGWRSWRQTTRHCHRALAAFRQPT